MSVIWFLKVRFYRTKMKNSAIRLCTLIRKVRTTKGLEILPSTLSNSFSNCTFGWYFIKTKRHKCRRYKGKSFARWNRGKFVCRPDCRYYWQGSTIGARSLFLSLFRLLHSFSRACVVPWSLCANVHKIFPSSREHRVLELGIHRGAVFARVYSYRDSGVLSPIPGRLEQLYTIQHPSQTIYTELPINLGTPRKWLSMAKNWNEEWSGRDGTVRLVWIYGVLEVQIIGILRKMRIYLFLQNCEDKDGVYTRNGNFYFNGSTIL